MLTTIKSKLLEKFKAKDLTVEQTSIAESLAEAVMLNEPLQNWNEDFATKYIQSPDFSNEDKYQKIQDIAYEHQVDNFLAAILNESYKD